jgi:hypothetical protein
MCSNRLLLVVILILAAGAGCGGGEPVTPQAIQAARRAWDKARIRDYDLEWTSTGLMNGHYRVTVRDGKVRRIVAVLPDGRAVERHPAQPELYGVDGLFQVIEDELAQLDADRPFGQPKGTSAVLKFQPDPKLGYPKSYRRDVVGTPQGLTLDVIRLTPRAPAPTPPAPVAPAPASSAS